MGWWIITQNWSGPILSNFSLSPIVGVVDYSQGLQVSGVGSLAHRSSQGLQIAGVFSKTGQMEGFQVAGVFNHAESVKGAQVGGVFSESGSIQGVQINGIFGKSTGNVQGGQVSGIFNTVDGNVRGVQVASMVNHATDVRGAQAGLVNVARGTVYGTQIGLVNISDDMYGVPLGIFNWVRNGIRDTTFWFSGEDRMWVGFQRGTRNFYHILSVGWDRSEDLQQLAGLAAGAGLGVRIRLDSLFVDAELGLRRATTGQTTGDRFTNLFTGPLENTFPHARLAGGLALGRKFKIYLGMDLDGLVEGWTAVNEFHTTWDGDVFTVPVRDGWGIRVFPKFFWGITLF